ncbi:two-component system response regulator [Marinobacter nauticus]|uniref:Response regulator receiver modulated metal dependent phosphohydrolase n=1 Tax=Marinobacter nauticus TaxID=2743 RepID=A0A368V717_MARNT|nr:two-component system response regulator [Marinobacter nauticus]RBP76019.1 response regulator receiver modulated metal dependent phosphohydrolase [Marinobacter nauticus]RCW36892.1 response regulator receiver modulated metal dependent phosphohydrolase [Marinobacter nauticus]
MLTDTKTLLLVDDEPANLQVLRNVLSDHYRLLFAKDGERALELARSEKPDLVLLDVMMPGMSGYEVCKTLKAGQDTRAIPVIFVTALSDADDEARGFELGAVDYLTKPVNAAIVRARVKNHLSLVRMDELIETRLAVVQRLGRAAEYKDNETGLHVIRMSHFSRLIALEAGLGEAWSDTLLNAAPMHDIGKIGIPDAILQKPGKLEPDEWLIMQRHAEIGAEIIGEDGSDLLNMAREVAQNHHEKWDGSGYPKGLKGTAIPISARIVALADVFDALTSERPYKKAWPIEQATDLIREQSGKHFDPELVEAFFRCLPAILEVRQRWQES